MNGGKNMMMDASVQADIDAICAHRYDHGADCFATPDGKLLKGAPFTTLESAMYLMELGVSPDDPLLKAMAELILGTWKEDGRFKTMPTGGIYPCHTALAANVLCRMGYAWDPRIQRTFRYFAETQREDGGWRCEKYSFGRGEETAYSTPYTTLVALDMFRFSPARGEEFLERAADFLLRHWEIRRPISPCHYGIGSLFMQVEYPFRGYNLFYYVYVLSFYRRAREDGRFLQALDALRGKLVDGQMPVERVVPKLARLNFCRKGQPSAWATRRYREIERNMAAD